MSKNPEGNIPDCVNKLKNEYEKSKNLYQKWYYILQIASIILSGITPILLIPEVNRIPRIFPGITAGLASGILAGSNVLKLREKYASNKVTYEIIRAEISKFTEMDEEMDKKDSKKNKLIKRVFDAHLKRLSEWEDIMESESSVMTEENPNK